MKHGGTLEMLSVVLSIYLLDNMCVYYAKVEAFRFGVWVSMHNVMCVEG